MYASMKSENCLRAFGLRCALSVFCDREVSATSSLLDLDLLVALALALGNGFDHILALRLNGYDR